MLAGSAASRCVADETSIRITHRRTAFASAIVCRRAVGCFTRSQDLANARTNGGALCCRRNSAVEINVAINHKAPTWVG